MLKNWTQHLIISFTLLANAGLALAAIPSAPQLSARSYILMDYDSSETIASQNEHERVPPASLTKLMTAYIAEQEIAAGNLKLTDKVLISEKAWRAEGSRMFLEVNKEVSVEDLLRGIVIQSGNDASTAIAEAIAGSESGFAQLMNEQAAILGMNDTHFVNATGLPDDQQYSSAYDMALLAQAIIRNSDNTYHMYKEKWFVYNDIRQPNRNRLLWWDDSVDGLKTGHTDSAGYC
ncbi:MAG: D-alanyl-D-alanine carboxypeptidase family protein, partial [Gammaproteobacteria bacterium]